MYVNLRKLPSPNPVYSVTLPKLNGGLNLRELDYRLDANESPAMKNMIWKDGVLQCRDGQVYVSEAAEPGTGYAAAERLFHGRAFFHIGTALYSAGPGENPVTLTRLTGGVPEGRGTFFRYGGALYYKNRGGYFRVVYDGDGFRAEDMTDPDNACTPVTVINAAPESGAGTLYQPENRLSPRKTVWYTAESGVTVYRLPVQNIDAVTRVEADGVVLTEGTDYTVNLLSGVVTFASAPPVTEPETSNTVRVTYAKANAEALEAVLSCPYAIAYGSGNGLCVLLGGSSSQPNAVFWNGNDSAGMHPGYFPATNYNLCGGSGDAVTGFAQQYDDLMVCKERSVGKLIFSVESAEGRDLISFAYQSINAKIGCDLPWSIQQVTNNVVFCNTLRGVCLVNSASAAYENNISVISEKVNGNANRGLLADVRDSETGTVSADDNEHYWLCANGHCYVWDYHDTEPGNPSWYYFEGVNGAAYFLDDAAGLYHLNAAGRVTKFMRSFADYDAAIEKSYTIPTQSFGNYGQLKDVLSVLLAVRNDTDSEVLIRYDTDYETRYDRTPIDTRSWRLSPRNLRWRSLAVFRYARVARRTPGCRHVRHFSLTLSNNVAQEDLAIVSAQIFYRFTEKER